MGYYDYSADPGNPPYILTAGDPGYVAPKAPTQAPTGWDSNFPVGGAVTTYSTPDGSTYYLNQSDGKFYKEQANYGTGDAAYTQQNTTYDFANPKSAAELQAMGGSQGGYTKQNVAPNNLVGPELMAFLGIAGGAAGGLFGDLGGAASGAGGASANGMDLMYGSGMGSGAGTTAGSGTMSLENLLGDYSSWGNYGADATSGGTLDLSSLYPDFTNYSGQMSSIPGLEQSLTQIPMDFSAGSALTQPGVWDTVKQIAKTGGDVKSVLSQLGITGSDLTKALGSLASAGIGAYASNQQTSALEAQAQRYEGYGAPYRQRLSDLYANPDSFLGSKEVQTPVQMGTDNLMRSLSTQGNPFGSGNALQQGQSYASDQLFSRLGQEKDRLAGFGGLASYNAAAPAASTSAINSTSNSWNAVGAGVNNIFNPPQTPAQQAAEWMKAMGK